MSGLASISKIEKVWSLYKKGIPVKIIVYLEEKSQSTIYDWISKIKFYGIQVFKRRYKNAKKGSRKGKRRVPAEISRLIFKIREDQKGACGEVIQHILKTKHSIVLSVSTIYRILKKKFVLRKGYAKNQKRGSVRKATKKGASIQVDTVHFGEIYAFTA